ncbi:MAG: hypothetical protein KZQ89_19390 [Candidatus Thiodiazotropha sp. (ex Lucinoma kastoroae)]|nr:hypothetical protein [Candidatus Thiodiazotropha sp. (ex Lucinoma kastoroae)]
MFGISNKKQLSQLNEQLLEKASQMEALEAQLTSLREENGQISYHPHSGGFEVAPHGGAYSIEGPIGAM